MDLIKFWTICSSNGIVLNKKQIDDLKRFAGDLIYWNKKVNLISRKDEDEILAKHILHSLTILKYIEIKNKAKCLDIGTGGGFPGIPLKIALPTIDMLLVDSIAKKIKITNMFAQHTGQRNIIAKTIRAEELSKQKEYKNYFDFIFARAVTKTNKIVRWSEKILKKGGMIVLLKGGNLDKEIAQAKEEFPKLQVEEIQINLLGANWFKKDEKKILICKNLI